MAVTELNLDFMDAEITLENFESWERPMFQDGTHMVSLAWAGKKFNEVSQGHEVTMKLISHVEKDDPLEQDQAAGLEVSQYFNFMDENGRKSYRSFVAPLLEPLGLAKNSTPGQIAAAATGAQVLIVTKQAEYTSKSTGNTSTVMRISRVALV